MKNCFVILILLLLQYKAHAQGAYFGMGYNTTFAGADELDFVINRYNETRNYLDMEMELPHFQDGFVLHIGIHAGAFLLDVGYTGRSAKVSATGTDVTGTHQQRDFKTKMNSIDIGLGGVLAQNSDLAFALGINTAMGNEKSQTRSGLSDDINTIDYLDIDKSFTIAFEPFMQFIFSPTEDLAFIIKPYYHMRLMKIDYAPVNAAMNPSTAGNDPFIMEGKQKGFGISVMMGSYSFSD
ncbi:MAG: hypothetical protein H7X71_00400 [Chitinophagales bacterium]|nr:hypothetical protein [Chitinophagales bacterium]